MINLLPLQYKKEFHQKENFKIILILGSVFLAVLVSFSLILLSIKIYISGGVEVQKILVEQKVFKSSSAQEFEQKIEENNLIISQLNSFYQKELTKSEILEKISHTLPLGTYLTNLNISTIVQKALKGQPKQEKQFSVSLSGFAPRRETLLELERNLMNEKLFQDIFFPTSNWLKQTDIDFLVNFKIKPK